MSKLILWLTCAVACIFAVWGLMDNPGSVSITWFGYVLETSVAFCIGLFACIVLIIYLISFPKRWVRWIKVKLEKKKTTKNKELLIQILTNIVCKDFSANNTLIKKFQKTTSKDSELLLLLKALSGTDSSIYNLLVKNPKTEKAGWQGLINEHIQRGEIVLASEEVEKLLAKNPKKEWILKEAFSLYILNEDWNKALNCLETLNKIKAVDSDAYDYQKAVLLVRLNKGTEAFKINPSLPAAAILAAKENPKKAEKIYRMAWEEKPSFDVYKAFVKLYAKENTLSQYKHVLKLCESNKNAKINPLVIADAAMNAQLWSEAKKELNGYLANHQLTTNIVAQMARIEIEANHNMKEAQKWMEKMNGLETTANYICDKCTHKTDVWQSSCPVCNQFAGLKTL